VLHSPSAVLEVASCPANAGRASALAAARLALGSAHSAGAPRSADAAVLAIDRADADGSPAQCHTLAWADDDARLVSLSEWTARSGLARADGFVLAEALLMAHSACQLADTEAVRTMLWIDEHHSVLTGAAGRRLCFVRSLPIGTESLVEAVAHTPSLDGASTLLSVEDSRSVLERFGIPEREQPVDALRGILGKSLLPSLQPVLQRFGVELKQSVRFGLSESDRVSLTIELVGPGAKVANLAPAIGAVTGFEARAVGPSHEKAPSLTDLALGHPAIGRLTALSAQEAGEFRKARRMLHAGLASAFVLVGIDAAFTALDASRRPAPDPYQSARVASADVAREAIDMLSEPLARFDEALARVAPSDAHWRPFLESLAAATPPEVRFEAVRAEARAEGAPAVRLVGRATGPGALDSARSVRAVLEALEGLPIVSGVELVSTGRATENGQEVQRFEIACGLLSLPRFASAEATAVLTSSTEQQP